MDYYKPTVLFRQNAIKKVRSNPELHYSRKFSHESWLLDDSTNNDILDKSCSNNKIKIASHYWKIPDEELYLTSVAANRENPEQIAISSGKKESNLFIYDINFDQMSLTHQQTITLPYIQSMQWLNYDECESTLLTGHKNGAVHMVSIPDSTSEENASILKRFNHKKHFTTDRFRNLSIKKILIPNWISNSQSFLTQCNENIFLWDMNHRSDLPILKNQNLGLLNFDASMSQNGILALCGEFGIALNDLRAPINAPSIFTPKDAQNLGSANNIKWAPYDNNILAASHTDGVVRLWDIRAQGSFGNLVGHNDLVTSLEWSEESSSDLYSGSRDGSIIHWDLNLEEDLSECCLSEGLESIKYLGDRFLTDKNDIYATVNKRQCGTLIPAANSCIVDITSVANKLISIDGSSYLGVHGKRGVDSFTVEEGTSALIMEEMLQEIPFISNTNNHANEEVFISSGEEEEGDEESDPIFEQNIDHDESSPTTAVNSPVHDRQKSITILLNNSDHSVNTLVDHDEDLMVERRESGSTLKEPEQVIASFTYEKIAPLNQRTSQETLNASQMTYI